MTSVRLKRIAQALYDLKAGYGIIDDKEYTALLDRAMQTDSILPDRLRPEPLPSTVKWLDKRKKK